MQTASTSIYERIDHSQELGELQCGRMCNKSSQEISALATINQSTVNGGMFSERTNHASPSGNPMDESRFDGFQDKTFGEGGFMVWGCFSGVK